MPSKYSVTLLVLSGIFHWLVSQHLFLASISAFTSNGIEDPYNHLQKNGYSDIAIIMVIAVGTIVVLLGALNGVRGSRLGVPLAGSCSALISATCHGPTEDIDAGKVSLIWGAPQAEGVIGHCCLTSLPVEKPVVGRFYAGLNVKGGWKVGTAVARDAVDIDMHSSTLIHEKGSP